MNKSVEFFYHRFARKLQGLPGGAIWLFLAHQAWAALFGGFLLIAIVVTQYVELPWLSRYDWLFLIAIAIQLFMLITKLEKPHEIITILLFHLVGLGMEVFKTSAQIGSWSYPGEAIFRLENVPLFSGFMYAAVGSYIARAWRVLRLTFTHYPPRFLTVFLAVAIYGNFFTHHYIYDLRYVLFLAVALLFGRVFVSYTIYEKTRRMPLIVGFGLIALVIWAAENISTYTSIWLYPNQVDHWEMVGVEKLGSWFLLMIISFIMIDLLYHIRSSWRQNDKRIKA
jgi:uncharacterized membrane protein YoaT (DUF817 family)